MSVTVTWEWADDKGGFSPFPKTTAAALESHYSSNQHMVDLKIRGVAYSIDLIGFEQKNPKTQRTRDIRRVDADGSITVCRATWQVYVEELRRWVPYAPENSRDIERARLAEDLKVSLVLAGHKVKGMKAVVHLGHMHQTCEESDKTLKIRRLTHPAVISAASLAPAPAVSSPKKPAPTTAPATGAAVPKKRGREEEAPASTAKKTTATAATSGPLAVSSTATVTLSAPHAVGSKWTNINSVLVRSVNGITKANKIVGFDLDDTLVTPKSGNKFAKNADDWRWLCPEVPIKLRGLVAAGYVVVIFSNQAGVGKGGVIDARKAAEVKKRIDNVAVAAGLSDHLIALLATDNDEYRKPGLGMWKLLLNTVLPGSTVDTTASCYVGDAAGRTILTLANRVVDFACTDRMFGFNLDIPFHTPEEFFQGKAKDDFDWAPFDPQEILRAMESTSSSSSSPTPSWAPRPSVKQEIVVTVGFPGSGKSSLVKKHFLSKGYVHVSRDVLKTPEKCVKVATEAVAAGKSVIVDNTSPSSTDRARYINVGNAHGVPTRCLWMATTEAMAKHLNAFRKRLRPEAYVPGIAYNMYKKNFEEPTTSEGFVHVAKVTFTPDFSDIPLEHHRTFLEVSS
eukprot:PhM_4_TR13293/c0_g1_i1/m.92133/K08073/PNKP; bifunctional polynucleotide phosphatase/kinase